MTEPEIRDRMQSLGLPGDLENSCVEFFLLLQAHYERAPADCGYRPTDPAVIRQGRELLDQFEAMPPTLRPSEIFR